MISIFGKSDNRYLLSVLLFCFCLEAVAGKSGADGKSCQLAFPSGAFFRNQVRGQAVKGQLRLSDTILYEDQHFVIKPGLGAITAPYILFIPKRRLVNFGQVSMGGGPYFKWSPRHRLKPIRLISNILSKHFNYDGNFIWFEHGEMTSGKVPGSNIDHGHIHIILNPPFTFESFRSQAISMDRQHWKFVTTDTAYNNYNEGQPYLVFGDKNKAFWANLRKPKKPQFFRKVAAKLVGKTNEWNYRKHPHNEMILETIDFMEGLNVEWPF